ncbi:hypothetical protein [Marinitenerispora sediminis]|uniref:Aminoglycoside phosphotransferase domain-containing protein n=1 Tax=Marinitenerispora sediminis TaxID=1931232 RepID=A0A368T451_9ACTN|nr:hypothetical protein [Marinitenerispora sediminis]RCV55865.1 hypothetical protein DEF28_04730 [Marinitenerispora sediminis]RCV57328.1 hypothetical protein DEF24_15355 [Marinitenerispora sediminis]RCV59416.1 hypothetical protein DEF23_07620 [Marinitenerispora sediminis]
MLPTADAALTDRDPGLPSLRTLLDPDALRERLAALLPAGAEPPMRVRVDLLDYLPGGPGRPARAAAVLEYADRTRRAVLTAHPADSGLPEPPAGEARPRPAPSAPGALDTGELDDPGWPGTLADPEHGLTATAAAADPDLPALRHFTSAAGAFAPLPGGRVRTLRHEPGRRWTGRAEDADGRPGYAVRCRAGGVNVAAHLALAAAGVPVPDIGRVSRYGVLATRWVPGGTLADLLAAADPASADALAAAGALLARIHAVAPPRELPGPGPAPDTAAAARAVAALLPDLAERAAAVAGAARAAVERADRAGDPPVLSPGAFSADRLAAGERLSPLHLERVRVTHPAEDLAEFAAGEIAAGRVPAGAPLERVLGPLLDGYLAAAPRGGTAACRALAARTAGALLRRAVRPFRHRDPHWPERTAELLAAAEVLSNG